LRLPEKSLSLASQLPQGRMWFTKFMNHTKTCGSWLASEEALELTDQA
jgi:hypothetical protein